jgi:hypothetical protein
VSLTLCAIALVWTLGAYVSARTAIGVTRRLGVDPMGMLLWLGLAEGPGEERRSERRRLAEMFLELEPSARR